MPTWGGDARYLALVEEHGTSLLHLATFLVGNHHDAEDIVQDALLAVASKWPAPFSASYLRKAVSNRAIDFLRTRGRFVHTDVPDSGYVDRGLFHLEEHQAFFDLVQGLPNGQRHAVILRYYADLTDNEVAAMLEISVQTVRSQIHRGLEKLRAAQEAKGAH